MGHGVGDSDSDICLGAHLWWVLWITDKHMQNKKELTHLRRFLPAARTTRAPGAKGGLF